MSSETRYCLDASALITAWVETHPIEIFPTLWSQLGTRDKSHLILIEDIFKEIEPYPNESKKLSVDERKEKYPLRYWLENNGFHSSIVEDEVNQIALMLESKYRIENEVGRGASKNDILLIAYAQYHEYTVVTSEAIQKQKPEKKSKYKIPLICSEEDIESINFVELLRQLEIKI